MTGRVETSLVGSVKRALPTGILALVVTACPLGARTLENFGCFGFRVVRGGVRRFGSGFEASKTTLSTLSSFISNTVF